VKASPRTQNDTDGKPSLVNGIYTALLSLSFTKISRETVYSLGMEIGPPSRRHPIKTGGI